MTPADLFNNYQYAWASERTRPQPVIIETQYAWDQRFSPHARPVRGFTRTEADSDYVRAFRFTLGRDRSVQMHMKGSARDPILVWSGLYSMVQGLLFLLVFLLVRLYQNVRKHL